MFKFQYPKKVKFFCGFIFKEENHYNQSKAILIKKFGKIDFESENIDFSFTDYYNKEFGIGLIRKFISFKYLKNADDFVRKNFAL